jgi:hypothetical protein
VNRADNPTGENPIVLSGGGQVADAQLRGFDRNLLAAGRRLEHRVREAVPFCWFCPATHGRRSREHVFPQWLLRHYGAEQERVAPHRWTSDGVLGSQRAEMPLSSVVAGEVCEACNSRWMSQLETDVAPVLTAAPRRGRIPIEDALVLARWFTKVAVALNVSMPFRLLFDAPTRHALADGMPDNVIVALSIARRTHGFFDWAQTNPRSALVDGESDASDLRRDMALAYVGHVRVDRLVATVLVLPTGLLNARPDMPARQVWPPSRPSPTWGALPRVRDYRAIPVHLDVSAGRAQA